MRAAQATGYGENANQILTVQDEVATPRIGDKPPAGFKNAMLVRVLAVALAPGDVRVMSGKTREFQGERIFASVLFTRVHPLNNGILPGPPSFPYAPGGDVCGIVVEVPEENGSGFGVGDRIAARFVNKPMGALGEYALVSPDVCDVVPSEISSEGAAALVSSGTVAVLIADKIQEGDKVLIFGAGGGVGSHLCQLARLRGASYVAGVGRDPKRLTEKPISCDVAIDYTKDDPFAATSYSGSEAFDPFDVIVDLSGGVWPALLQQRSNKRQSIIKSANKNGRYLTTTPDKPIFEIHSVWGILKLFLFPPLWRAFYTRVTSRSTLPKYSYVMALPGTAEVVTRTLALCKENKLVPSIDEQGPFPFTSSGVRDAFNLQASRHAKGKVVITVANE